MKNIFFIACLSLLIGTACTDNNQQKSLSSGNETGNKQQQPVAQVNVITIRVRDIAISNELPGRVRASATAEIRPQVSGIIQSRMYKEGSLVEKDQTLYQIDPARYEADFQSAQANLQNALAELDVARSLQNRYQNLIKTNAISEQELDNADASAAQAKAAVALARAEVQSTEINLDYTKVRAPISGYIGPSTVTIGALVTAQQQAPLAVIRELDPVYVDLSQSAVKAQGLQERLMASRLNNEADTEFDVTIMLDDKHIYPEKGVLSATDLAVDENTGTIRLRAIFPNPDAILLPGMFVRATIDNNGKQKVIIVPQKAVNIEADGSKSVWIVDDNNIANKRQVTTSRTFENNWIIDEGLDAGDNIIVEGSMMLKPGAKVEPSYYANGTPENTAQTFQDDKDDSGITKTSKVR